MAKGIALGPTAVKQISDMLARDRRRYANEGPHTRRQPIASDAGQPLGIAQVFTLPAKGREPYTGRIVNMGVRQLTVAPWVEITFTNDPTPIAFINILEASMGTPLLRLSDLVVLITLCGQGQISGVTYDVYSCREFARGYL